MKKIYQALIFSFLCFLALQGTAATAQQAKERAKVKPSPSSQSVKAQQKAPKKAEPKAAQRASKKAEHKAQPKSAKASKSAMASQSAKAIKAAKPPQKTARNSKQSTQQARLPAPNKADQSGAKLAAKTPHQPGRQAAASIQRASQPPEQRQKLSLTASSKVPAAVSVGAFAGAAVGTAALGSTLSPSQRREEMRALGILTQTAPLDISAKVALVMDQHTGEVLYQKNQTEVWPIASLTKLMAGLVLAEAGLPLGESIAITEADVDVYKGSRSRLAVGSVLSRGELMHLALMSSENRAAHALGRTYPGGMRAFVARMNARARELGMADSRFVEPTGLLSANRSSARDLATLAVAAYRVPMLRNLSTSTGYVAEVGQRSLRYNNSNRLIYNDQWDIGLQKTGYISEAGRCLVMQVRVAGRPVIMVLLDAGGTALRAQDAERVRAWLETQDVRTHYSELRG